MFNNKYIFFSLLKKKLDKCTAFSGNETEAAFILLCMFQNVPIPSVFNLPTSLLARLLTMDHNGILLFNFYVVQGIESHYI